MGRLANSPALPAKNILRGAISRRSRVTLMPKRVLTVALVVMGMGLTLPAAQANPNDLIKLLDTRNCRSCKLQDADLVHADLRDADLRQAQLQRANLGQARLDGAQLSGANLSFTSLSGASLRGADLRGALLEGTDLRQADLSGALLDPGALSRSHWQRAKGIAPTQLSYAELHNAGAEAAQQGRYPEAEQFFGDAIRKDPGAAISWVARGISRSEQGKKELAASDFNYAASLYAQGGEVEQAEQLTLAAKQVVKDESKQGEGNGAGSQALGGLLSAFQFLAPLAIKGLLPLGL